ncbi:MAG: tyrosine--tRNA ligase [Clostridia bacterium]|nr:tyrosine--tRNA ligase [Clostridia bacterium]
MENIYDILEKRGYVKQVSHPEIRDELAKGQITFYVGFDATADSLHVGHFIQLMAMSWLQKAGHRPIALIGGGTTTIGDPSGRTDMRKMLTREQIDSNVEKFKKQIGKFLDFGEGKALMLNNADWLLKLNYLDFMRDIGKEFSVNKMLTAECFKKRMEVGLTFFEFSYMLMQAYDFLYLNRNYDCSLELGGDDQWSNILAGADLIRRKEQKPAFALTFALLTTADGTKMGKTAGGALWLDAEKTSPYEFYQYFRNVDDADVIKFLKLLTFLPLEEIAELAKLEGAELNRAKEVLAYEVTTLVHGKEEADKAVEATKALFSTGGSLENAPTTEIADENMNICDLLVACGLTKSKGEARRLIAGGGVSVNDEKVQGDDFCISKEMLDENSSLLIRKGKKTFHRVIVK